MDSTTIVVLYDWAQNGLNHEWNEWFFSSFWTIRKPFKHKIASVERWALNELLQTGSLRSLTFKQPSNRERSERFDISCIERTVTMQSNKIWCTCTRMHESQNSAMHLNKVYMHKTANWSAHAQNLESKCSRTHKHQTYSAHAQMKIELLHTYTAREGQAQMTKLTFLLIELLWTQGLRT